MNKDVVRAYIWEDIIKLGFSPSTTKNRKSWVCQYLKSFKGFCEIDSYPTIPKKEISGSICLSDIFFDYSIGKKDKFAVTVNFMQKNSELSWTHDFDPSFFSLSNLKFLNFKKRKEAVKKMKAGDVREVVESLITHPTPHQHINYPKDVHEIRIGGGLTNFFLYLFHLRFQLCPSDNRRRKEEDRLVNLFFDAIKKKETSVPINKLMEIPK